MPKMFKLIATNAFFAAVLLVFIITPITSNWLWLGLIFIWCWSEGWIARVPAVKWVELHSDNLTHNREYALALFKAIAPIGLKFYGETTVLIARDEELLEAAKLAGVKALMLGIEPPSKEALKAQKKGFVKPEKNDYR